MKKDTYEELQKKLADSEAKNKRIEAELREYIRAEDVLVAAKLVSNEQLQKAHDLVESLTKD